MKTKITLIIATFFVCFTINAQIKVGTVDREYIIIKMPQFNQVQDRLKSYGNKLDSISNKKINEYDIKVKAFNDGIKTLSDADKKVKYSELEELNQDIAKFRENGAKMMQIKKGDFMRPLYKKVNELAAIIAKEKGYTQILTTTGNEFAFIDINHDITILVLAKLGIKE